MISSVIVSRFDPAVVLSVDLSRRQGPKSEVSSEMPVTESVPGPSVETEAST